MVVFVVSSSSYFSSALASNDDRKSLLLAMLIVSFKSMFRVELSASRVFQIDWLSLGRLLMSTFDISGLLRLVRFARFLVGMFLIN